MVWTPPMTALPEQTFTANDWNTYVRDNLLATMRGVSINESGTRYFASEFANTLGERQVTHDFIADEGTTTSTSYTDLTGSVTGPEVDVETGTSMLVLLQCRVSTPDPDVSALASFDITDEVDGAPRDFWAVSGGRRVGTVAYQTMCSISYVTGLAPGLHFVQMKYRVNGTGTGSFRFRRITIVPL